MGGRVLVRKGNGEAGGGSRALSVLTACTRAKGEKVTHTYTHTTHSIYTHIHTRAQVHTPYTLTHTIHTHCTHHIHTHHTYHIHTLTPYTPHTHHTHTHTHRMQAERGILVDGGWSPPPPSQGGLGTTSLSQLHVNLPPAQ